MSPEPTISNLVTAQPPPQETLVDLLRARAELGPDQVAYRFLHDGENDETCVTYAELEERVCTVAAALQRLARPGDRALLLYPPGLDYIVGYLGCLHAGVIAVPAYPPDPRVLERNVGRVEAIVEDAGAKVALTIDGMLGIADQIRDLAPKLAAVTWIATDCLDPVIGKLWKAPAVEADGIAFLQYTSGSTGSPKGVMVSHRNLLTNLRSISSFFDFPIGYGTHTVSWLPPYHDMGLVFGILMSIYLPIPAVLMSPLAFLERPLRWLRAISRYRGLISGGPGFAFDLCARKTSPAERADLDLRSWKLAAIGGEPIRAAALERFAAAFRDSGFAPTTFCPGYGLAESTLVVTGALSSTAPVIEYIDRKELQAKRFKRREKDDVDAWPLVGCGHAALGQEIRIVDEETLADCAAEHVGEVLLRGPSVALGYWGAAQESERTFHLTLPDGSGPYLRTGDLGFLDARGNLFITGRAKDLLIIRGRNHHPDDLEHTVADCHPDIRPGCAAAFSLDLEDGESLVVVQEVRRGATALEEVARAIRAAIVRRHGIQTYAVVLVEPGMLPKTSSGKIRRNACRVRFPTSDADPTRMDGIRLIYRNPTLGGERSAAEASGEALGSLFE